MTPPPESEDRRPPRVLCVDDEPAVREVLRLHLQRQGYSVETAADGSVALRLITQDPTRFDVIITDNQMPHLSGLGLVEQLRGTQFAGRIIFYSSTLPTQTAERLAALGVAAVVEKGQPVAQLLGALRESGFGTQGQA